MSNFPAPKMEAHWWYKTIETAQADTIGTSSKTDVVNVLSKSKASKGQSQRRKIADCRVSSSKHKDDLKRQEQSFRETHPNHEIIRAVFGLAIISREDFREWLTPYCKQTSKKLLSRMRTGSPGSPLTSSSGYAKEETHTSRGAFTDPTFQGPRVHRGFGGNRSHLLM
ncbi:unnamed protein product [Hapterophycus canaliculatus]